MYKVLTEIPVPSQGYFVDSNVIHLTFVWHDHTQNTKRNVTSSVLVSDGSHLAASPLQDVGDEVAFVFSPSGSYRAVLREIKNEKAPRRFVEVWENSSIVTIAEVTDKHGGFYTDEYLASLSFSPSESSLLYIAESNPPTATDEDPYKKFRFTPQFGEGIAEKRRPTIFVFSWDCRGRETTHSLCSLNIPSGRPLFGQAIFAPQGDVFYATGYEYTSDYRLLGAKGCFNRPTGIWEIKASSVSPNGNEPDLKLNAKKLECTLRKLTPSNLSCRSPRILSHSGKSTLLWVTNPAGGPHAATSALHALDVTSELDLTLPRLPLVDTVFDPKENAFPGFYPEPNLSKYPTLRLPQSQAPYLITNSIWGSRTTVLLISTEDGTVKDLTPDDGSLYSWKVLNTDGNSRVICARSAPTSPHEVILGEFSESGVVSWRVIYKPPISTELQKELSYLRASIVPIPGRYPTETIVIQSTFTPENEHDVRPCITLPHGGPHATTTTAFTPATVAFALERYTISQPNYRGSLGFGENYVRALVGTCGTFDVEDCIATTRHLISLGISVRGPGRQFVLGGSHGGFLSAHLIGQYPEMFSAAVMRNPVISAGEISTSDIPDWYYAEFGLEYPVYSSTCAYENNGVDKSRRQPPLMSPAAFKTVHDMSPIAYIDAVRASVLLLIGKSDLRVAPTQGVEYYHALKQRAREGSKVEMLTFEGESHPLEGVEAARVSWEAGRDFLKWAETLIVQFSTQ